MIYGVSKYPNPYLGMLFGVHPAAPPTFINPLSLIPPDSKNPLRSLYQDKLGNSLAGLNQQAKTVQSSSNPFVSKTDSIFNKRIITSSDTSVITATVKDKAKLTSYDVKVNQLAAAQKNTGTSLASTTVQTLGAGTFNFNVNIGGKTTSLSLTLDGTETNQTLLSNLAKKINDAGIGITASVSTSAGNSNLNLTAKTTGSNSSFSLNDTSGTLISYTGANAVTTSALDANYTVDGTDYVSQSNTVSLDAGKVSLTLKNTGASQVDLKVSQDINALADGMEKFIKDYNSFRDYLTDYAQYLNPRLATSLNRAFTDNQYELADLGITKEADGTLNLDREKFLQAADNDYNQAKDTLSANGGLIATINRQATLVSTTPTSSYARTQFGYGTNAPLGQGLYNYGELSKGLLVNFWF